MLLPRAPKTEVEAGLEGGCLQSRLAGDFPCLPPPTLVPTGNLTGLSPPDTHCVEPGVGCFPVRAPVPSSLLLSLEEGSSELLPLPRRCIKSCSTL